MKLFGRQFFLPFLVGFNDFLGHDEFLLLR
jgi:hypothetical protein